MRHCRRLMIRMDVLQHVVSQGDKMYLTKQIVAFWGKALRHKALNRKLLKPSDIYICRTAELTSRRYILNIYSTNIHTEYFKHAA